MSEQSQFLSAGIKIKGKCFLYKTKMNRVDKKNRVG